MAETSPIAGVIGGGGYATQTSFANARLLSSYTTTTQNYFGCYESSGNYYNFQTQIYWDLDGVIPEGAVITGAECSLYFNWSTNIDANTIAIYRDAWGAPSGWSVADMEIEPTLDNYPPLAELYHAEPVSDGVSVFTFSEYGLTYLNSIVNTSTELEVTVTDNCWVENVSCVGRKSYGYIDGAVEDIVLTYSMPHGNVIMHGCNI